jgi:hypothetical protein
MKQVMLDNEPIHGWFELSYAAYLVLPRSVLQSAPVEWQRKFVECLNELEEMFGDKVPMEGVYEVHLRSDRGVFIEDVYRDYERGRRVIPMTKKV